MKPLRWLAVTALLASAARLAAIIPAPEPTDSDLLVTINLEAKWHANSVPENLNAAYLINDPSKLHPGKLMAQYDHHLRMAFLKRLKEVFHQHGYRGRMLPMEDATEGDRGKPILSITLTRWALSKGDRFDCHFDARLITTQGTAQLGHHEHIEMMLNTEHVKDRYVGVEKATVRALDKFHEELVATRLLESLPHGESSEPAPLQQVK